MPRTKKIESEDVSPLVEEPVEEKPYTMTESTVPAPVSQEEKQDAAREVKREAAEVVEAATDAEKLLEDKLLAYYEARGSGPFTLRDLVMAVGGDEDSVSLAWHRLFDTGKVPSPTFSKP